MSSSYLLSEEEQNAAISILAKRRSGRHGCLYEDLAIMIRRVWVPLTPCEKRREIEKLRREHERPELVLENREEARRQAARALLFSELGI